MASTFNIDPGPQYGSGTFGGVPGSVGLPDVFGDLASRYPALGDTNTAASAAVLSRLRGELSPATQNAIQDASARFGVSSGMPGSGLSQNRFLRDIGLTSEQEQQTGLEDYNRLAGTISSTQTVNPALQTQIAEQNALNRAAPNPQAAQTYAQKLYDQYLKGSRGGGASMLGGSPSRTPAAPSSSMSPMGSYTNLPAEHGTLSQGPTYGDMGNYNPFAAPAGGAAAGGDNAFYWEDYTDPMYNQVPAYSGPPLGTTYDPNQDLNYAPGMFSDFGGG